MVITDAFWEGTVHPPADRYFITGGVDSGVEGGVFWRSGGVEGT